MWQRRLQRLLQGKLKSLYQHLFEHRTFNKRRKKRLADFGLAHREQAPIAKLDCRLHSTCDTALCLRASLNYDNFFGTMHRFSDHLQNKPDRRVTLMALDLRGYANYEAYLAALRKKSFFIRKANRSKKAGYIVEPFQFENYTPDMRTIRSSVTDREEGLPIDLFVLTQDALHKNPDSKLEIKLPSCARHWEMWFGVFEPRAGFVQGGITTDQKLIAYARLRRIGNTIKYAEFIGHGEALADGVMTHLHLEMVQWIMWTDNPHTRGVDYLTYNTVEKGNNGIFFWKRKGLFAPHIIEMLEPELPEDFNASTYLALNPDVAKDHRDPVTHYLLHGHAENRRYK